MGSYKKYSVDESVLYYICLLYTSVSGTLWEGRAMVGSSFHELDFHKMMNPDFSRKAEEIAGFLLGKNVSCARAAFDVYCQDYARSHGGDISEVLASDAWERILTDYMYRTYSYRLARRLAGKGYHSLDVSSSGRK